MKSVCRLKFGRRLWRSSKRDAKSTDEVGTEIENYGAGDATRTSDYSRVTLSKRRDHVVTDASKKAGNVRTTIDIDGSDDTGHPMNATESEDGKEPVGSVSIDKVKLNLTSFIKRSPAFSSELAKVAASSDKLAPLNEIRDVHDNNGNTAPGIALPFISSTSAPQPLNTHSALLLLPAEIRNRIYEYALLSPDRVNVDSSLRSPGLLSTCRQINRETSRMWYRQNNWMFRVRDCDATGALLLRWSAHLRSLGVYRAHCIWVKTGGVPNWGNLMAWCKGVQEGVASALTRREDAGRTNTVVTSALKIARMYRGRSWEECEKVLREYRRAVGCMDRRWLKDRET